MRPLILIGFLGGWTTYSTLAVDATLRARHGGFATCRAYLAATVVGGLSLVVAGHAVARSGGMSPSPTLGLALLVAVAGGAGAVLRCLLIHTGHRVEAVVDTVGSLVLCLAAAASGLWVAGLA